MWKNKFGGGFRSMAVLAALFCTAVLSYKAGLRQTNAGVGASEKTYVLKFGGLVLHLNVGTLGVAVILALTILLAISILFTWLAYRRKREVERANRELENQVTERRRAEEEVNKLNADLERRVVERTRELDAANKELEAFSYSVSHDLRAPLRAIDGFSKALLDEYSDKLNQQACHYLQRVRTGIQKMSGLIDDLLNLSRMSRVVLRKEPIDLTALARGVVAELREREPARRVAIEIGDGLTARGDTRLTNFVLVNLLGNAWKYTGKRSQAQIAFGQENKGEETAFYVRDNGAGFDMAYADKLFTPFQRLHQDSEFEGTGIGLATVQRIVSRHGGRIWAEAAIDKGATFYFTLGDIQ
jgi:light-regulated signal transduction histidine kinase (bacteriophytochrome)